MQHDVMLTQAVTHVMFKFDAAGSGALALAKKSNAQVQGTGMTRAADAAVQVTVNLISARCSS